LEKQAMNKDAAILVIDSNKFHGELLVKELSDIGASDHQHDIFSPSQILFGSFGCLRFVFRLCFFQHF
jgi:hypothetical protein